MTFGYQEVFEAVELNLVHQRDDRADEVDEPVV
jgi:hypothetical protein